MRGGRPAGTEWGTWSDSNGGSTGSHPEIRERSGGRSTRTGERGQARESAKWASAGRDSGNRGLAMIRNPLAARVELVRCYGDLQMIKSRRAQGYSRRARGLRTRATSVRPVAAHFPREK